MRSWGREEGGGRREEGGGRKQGRGREEEEKKEKSNSVTGYPVRLVSLNFGTPMRPLASFHW